MKSSKKRDLDELWQWHKIIEEFKASGLTKKEFVEQHDIDYKDFSNKVYIAINCSRRDSQRYEEMLMYGREYLSQELGGNYGGRVISKTKFAAEYGIKHSQLTHIIAHIKYLDNIEKLKLKHGSTTADSTKKPNSIIKPKPQEPDFSAPRKIEESIISADIDDAENDESSFFLPAMQVPNPVPMLEKLPAPIEEPKSEPEFLPEQNSIELTISAGVKVIVSPGFPTEKILKIFQLLKDL